MIFKRFFRKEDKLLKKEILYDFMVLEKYHRTSRGESKWISLHGKYSFGEERDKYYTEAFDIYLKADDVTNDVIDFVKRYGFEKTDTLPKDTKHILGNYNMKIIAIDGFIT